MSRTVDTAEQAEQSSPVFSAEQIEQMLEELDRKHQSLVLQYETDRETLLRMRDLLGRQNAGVLPISSPPPSAAKPPKTVRQLKPQKRGNHRALIRQYIAQRIGDFTFKDLMDDAREAGDVDAIAIDPATWSSALYDLNQRGAVKMVADRRGNLPATYRLAVTPHELLNPAKKRIKRAFPLQDYVQEAIRTIPQPRFSRTELHAHLVASFPDYLDKFSLETTGAVLNRLAKSEEVVKTFSRNPTGNTYERI